MPISSALGAALGGSATQGAFNLFSAKQQQNASRDAYKHRYQWAVQDMKKAGLNPILAAKGPGGSPSMSQAGPIDNPASAAATISLQRANKDAAIQMGNKLGEEAKLATQNALESVARTEAVTNSAKATQLDNIEREREQTFLNNNPWLRPVKYIMENLGAAGAALIGGGLGYTLKDTAKGSVSPNIQGGSTNPPQTVPPSIQYKLDNPRVHPNERGRSTPRSKQRGGPAAWAEKWNRSRRR